MSVLSDMYDATFDVYRQMEVSGERKPALSLVVSGGSGLYTPVTETVQLYDQANMGKEYDLYCDINTDILVNDIVEIESLKYGVLYVGLYVDREDTTEQHIEARITKRK